MELVRTENDIKNLKYNTIYGTPVINSSIIRFKGKNNILYCADKNMKLLNCELTFCGDNSIIFLGTSMHCPKTDYTYSYDKTETLCMTELDSNFKGLSSITPKLEKLKLLYNSSNKNRFYISNN